MTAVVSLANQIILNNSNKDCDWLILACFIQDQYTADATFTPLEIKVWFQNPANAWGNYWILYHKTNKEVSAVLCSVVKQLGCGRALKKWETTFDCVSCFSLHFFRALPRPACFTTEVLYVRRNLDCIRAECHCLSRHVRTCSSQSGKITSMSRTIQL